MGAVLVLTLGRHDSAAKPSCRSGRAVSREAVAKTEGRNGSDAVVPVLHRLMVALFQEEATVVTHDDRGEYEGRGRAFVAQAGRSLDQLKTRGGQGVRAVQAERQLVAVVASYDRCEYDRLRVRASEVGLQVDGAFAVRLDRVVIEMLLRDHLSSTSIREEIIPSLLAQRVLLSWWRPNVSAAAAHESWADMAADPEVFCAVMVPLVVKTWVMEALTGWEL